MMKDFLKKNIAKIGPLIGLIVITVILGVLSDTFFTLSNIFNLLRQVSVNALIAFGMTFVILTARIDLSVGSLLALGSRSEERRVGKGLCIRVLCRVR